MGSCCEPNRDVQVESRQSAQLSHRNARGVDKRTPQISPRRAAPRAVQKQRQAPIGEDASGGPLAPASARSSDTAVQHHGDQRLRKPGLREPASRRRSAPSPRQATFFAPSGPQAPPTWKRARHLFAGKFAKFSAKRSSNVPQTMDLRWQGRKLLNPWRARIAYTLCFRRSVF